MSKRIAQMETRATARDASRAAGGNVLRKLLALAAAAAAVALVTGVSQASAASHTTLLAPPDLVVSSVTPDDVTVTNLYAVYRTRPMVYRPTATAGPFRVRVETGHSCYFPCVWIVDDVREFYVSSLAPGASASFLLWGLRGDLVRVNVDSLGQVYERNETNNVYFGYR